MENNSRDSAEKATRAYLATLGSCLLLREQSLCLLRAWTLARSVGSSVLEANIVAAIMDMANDVVARADDPYAAIPLLVPRPAKFAPFRRGRCTRDDGGRRQ